MASLEALFEKIEKNKGDSLNKYNFKIIIYFIISNKSTILNYFQPSNIKKLI